MDQRGQRSERKIKEEASEKKSRERVPREKAP